MELKIFDDKKIRTHWDDEKEKWLFSVVDICWILTNSDNYLTARKYWNKLKQRLISEGSELVTFCHQLKLTAQDGKQRETDVLDTKGVLRLIQSIPSPKAEPFKVWLAQVGNERLEEIVDPEKAITRGADYYKAKGYSNAWINQRVQSINSRNKLTDEWKERGIKDSKDYAILTNEMTFAWSGKTVKAYKEFKGIKNQNLRDNMTDIELALNTLAEVTTTAISKQEQPNTFEGNKRVAQRGGNVAKNAREDIENQLQKSVISPLNAKSKQLLESINKD